MFNLLNHLECLVCDTRNPDECIFSALLKNINSYDINLNSDEIERTIKQEAFEIATSPISPKIIKNNIRILQQSIIRVLDYIYKEDNHCKLPDTCDRAINNSYSECLMRTLEFLEHQFPKHFNYEANIPLSLFNKKKAKINKHLQYIESKTNYLKVIKKVLKPFKKFILLDSTHNFNEVKYLSMLILKLRHLVNLENQDKYALIHNLIFLCISYNFNTTSSYNFITEHITSELKHESNTCNKILQLTKYEKQISQILDNTKVKYSSKHDSLKKSLLHWITKEIAYYNYLPQTSPEATTNQHNILQENALPKIKTSLSVPQAAYFIRQLIDQKIIITDNKEETIRFFSEILSSKYADEISFNSFRSKFFKPELRTIEHTKQLFLKLFKGANLE